jgi:hypothetical protein
MENYKKACTSNDEEPVDILDKLQTNSEKLLGVSKGSYERLRDILSVLTNLCNVHDTKLEMEYIYYGTFIETKENKYYVYINRCGGCGETTCCEPIDGKCIGNIKRKLTITKNGPELISSIKVGEETNGVLTDVINVSDGSISPSDSVVAFLNELNTREICTILSNIPELLIAFDDVITRDLLDFNESVEQTVDVLKRR